MNDLLTNQEYQSMAKSLTLANNAFIDGKFTAAQSGKTFTSINPATEETITKIAACDKADVNIAVEKAQQAFDKGTWSKMHPSGRKQILRRWAKIMQRQRHELAVLESLDSGKPIVECQLTDIPETIHCIEWHAELADKLYGKLSPSGEDGLGLIFKEPLGVVACVLPWNFPLMMLAWKLGPALAAGNSVLVKPAEQTSLTALRIAEFSIEAGIPSGVLNIITGLGEESGEAIGKHSGIQAVSFTGSTEVGRKFLQYSAESNLKKIVLECGGKNPAVVLEDAEHLNHVAKNIVFAALWNMGQNCTANSRIIIHKDKKQELTDLILHHWKTWKTGDPMDQGNKLGAIVSKEQYKRILSYIKTGISENATLLTGGSAIKSKAGFFIEPTLFDDLSPSMTITKEEIFGPVAGIITAENDEQAVQIANDTCFGLQASLYTSHLRKAHEYAKAIQAGTISINCYSEGDITTPFGGYKLSGFGGRDNSAMAHDQYTETKTVWIDLSSEYSTENPA